MKKRQTKCGVGEASGVTGRRRSILSRSGLHLSVLLVGVCLLSIGLFGIAPLAEATQVKIFRTEGSAGFLGGEMDGVSIDSLGRISLADRMERLSQIDEPFVFTAVESKGSWVVGTGNSGKVLRIDKKGEVTVLLDAEETEVFALFEDSDGSIYAGTSPSGKVYRIPPRGGEAEVAFNPGETYIWAIARDAKGKLLVATGPRGRLYAVDKKGEGEVLYDSLEPHLRSLLALPGGGALVGTAGEGRILRIAEDGTPRTLHDALQPEIVALALGPNGSFFAAALATEASAVNLGSSDSGSSGSSKEEAKEGETASSSENSTFSGTGSRPTSFSGARSEVLSISEDGAIESLGSFKEETVYSLLWHGGRLWIGTGQEGKLYSYRDGEMVLEKSCDEKQLVALLPGAEGPAIATGNPATLYRTLPGTERTGTYTSALLDAVQVSRLGSFRWIGQTPKQSGVAVSFRTGLSSDPDETWSPWSEPRSGTELSLGDLQKGRFVQWRAELKADDGRVPRMDAVEISYLQQNQKPEISELSVLDPGQVLVPANFNPSNQVFEPAHPNRDGIFTTLNASGRAEARVKTLWKLGYRSLRWQASDANQDPLTYSLSFRPAAGEDDAWLTMVEDLDESQYSFDATVLPDGVYRFRLVASDEGGNNPGEALAVEKVSGPVVVDHSPPEARTVRATGEFLEVEVRDAWNPLREALVSVDAGEWKPVAAADGLVDGRKETLKVQRPKDARLLLLRLTDAAHNVVTIDLLEGEFLKKRIAVYPGSFDPLHNGHRDLIERCLQLFDEVVVAVLRNEEKKPLFTSQERVEMIREQMAPFPSCRVDRFSGLLVDFVEQEGACCVVRGLRAVSDFEYEFQMALMNKHLNPRIETLFMAPKEDYTFLSSRTVKEVFFLGGNLEGLVPEKVLERLERLKAERLN